MSARFLVVGAGLSGTIVANQLATHGFEVDVFETRNHVGGNVFTCKDAETGIVKHVYGPHIFNTNNEAVWNFVSKYLQFNSYINRVKVRHLDQIYSFPINLHTINQFFESTFNPSEAAAYIDSVRAKHISEPKNFEEQALSLVGAEIYEAFLKGYTIKQWGSHPTELPASILKRIPIRFNYNDNYYDKKFQGIPIEGYTPLFDKLLDHKNINLVLNQQFHSETKNDYEHVFYSGTLDGYFKLKYGSLGYRTVYWNDFVVEGDYQGNAVINYSDLTTAHTRVVEHAHFYPGSKFKKSLVSFEFSKETTPFDEPFYPKRLPADIAILNSYLEEAKRLKNLTFLGRLGTYRYLDMDVTIEEAFQTVFEFLKRR
jgi:UDP-galactopyranose mutase